MHPTRAQLALWAMNALEPQDSQIVAAHLAGCKSCTDLARDEARRETETRPAVHDTIESWVVRPSMSKPSRTLLPLAALVVAAAVLTAFLLSTRL